MSDSFYLFFSHIVYNIIKLFMLLQTMKSHAHTISVFNCYSNDDFFFLLEYCILVYFIIILLSVCHINVLRPTLQHALPINWGEKKMS